MSNRDFYEVQEFVVEVSVPGRRLRKTKGKSIVDLLWMHVASAQVLRLRMVEMHRPDDFVYLNQLFSLHISDCFNTLCKIAVFFFELNRTIFRVVLKKSDTFIRSLFIVFTKCQITSETAHFIWKLSMEINWNHYIGSV